MCESKHLSTMESPDMWNNSVIYPYLEMDLSKSDNLTSDTMDLKSTEVVLLSVYLATLVILGLIGNISILIMFTMVKKIRKPMNYLFLNLAVSDCMGCIFGTLVCLIHVVRMERMSQQTCNFYGFVTFFGGK